VLRERNLALYVSSTSVSTLGTAMAEVALAFAVLEIGSPTDLGFVLLAREIPLVVFLLLGGVWADRISRQRVLIAADVLRGSAQATGAALLLTGVASVWRLALLQIVFGVAGAFSRPATVGLIQETVSPGQLQEANALIGLARSSFRVVGPALGGAIVVAASPGWALAADAASFGASALLLAAMRLPMRTVRVAGASVLGDLRDGWQEFTSRTWVWVMVVSFGLFQMTLFPALVVLGPYVAKTELGGASAWGTILAFQAVGAIIGGLVALRVRPGRPLVASALLAVPMAGMLALLGGAAPVWVIAAAGLVAAACLTTTDVFLTTTLQQKVPAHAISRISSFDWFGSVALNPVGYALIGPLSGSIGVSTTLYLAAVLNAAVAIGIALVPSVRAVRPGAEPAYQLSQ
jgi:MFS family permease